MTRRTTSFALLALVGRFGLLTACDSGASDPAQSSGTSSGVTSGSAGSGGGGGAGPTALSLPQLIRGAAMVNPEAFPAIGVRIDASPKPDAGAVTATLDGEPLMIDDAVDHFVAAVDASALATGEHALVVSAGGSSVEGTLVVSPGGVVHTSYAQVGAAAHTQIVHDVEGDRLLVAWTDTQQEKHAWLAELDGAGRRIAPADVRLDPEGTSATRIGLAYGGGFVGALYQANTDFDSTEYWFRVLGPDGTEVVAPVRLNPSTPGVLGTEFDVAWDGSAFALAWADFELVPAVVKKIYWMRIDPAGVETGPVEIASGEYDPDTYDGHIQDLQKLSIACEEGTCAVAYRREIHNALVDLSMAKVHLAVVDPAGNIVSSGGVMTSDWDIQEDPSLSAGGGAFVITFAGTDTDAAVNLPDPCDNSGRQKIYVFGIHASGAISAPAMVMGDVGQRFQATIGWHPEGAAVLWEDQREKCDDLLNGQNRLAVNFVVGGALESPYHPLPQSRLVAESWIGAASAGPNYVFVWTDERAGGSILDPRGQALLDTYWR